MNEVLPAAGIQVMQGVFHRAIERSRQEPAPTLQERLDRLTRLRAILKGSEQHFARAISADFGTRSPTETLIAETMFVLGEIKHATQHLRKWMAPQRVPTELQFLPGKNRLFPQPLGVVGIIAPWNYPLQLTLAPAVAALAAGNRIMVKPSELTPRFSALLKEVIAAKFEASEFFVTDVDGSIAERFAALPFDHLIFTGSTRIGRLVAEAAGRNLTPVTLELGGKSPAIVDRTADIGVAAERIAYGKLLNAGQTCIAPDYALVPGASVTDFAARLRGSMERMYGSEPVERGLHLDHLRQALRTAAEPRRRRPRPGRQRNPDRQSGRQRLEDGQKIPADHRDRRDTADEANAGGDLRPGAAGHGLRLDRRGDQLHQRSRPAAGAVLVRQR